MTIGERIKEIRNRLNMSQVAFADKINVSKQTLYKYENNIITNIPSGKIEAAAKLGNVSPAYLMGWDDNNTDNQLVNKPLLNKRDERDIAKRLNAMLYDLENQQDALMFNGEALDDTTKELLKASLENSLRVAKINAKEKFTPKKYRKE